MQLDKVSAKLLHLYHLFEFSLELTWAQRVAGDLLHRHALAERPAVERRRVSAGSRSLLDTPPTWHVTGRPLGPQGPAAVHCRVQQRRRSGVRAQFFPTSPTIIKD